MRKLRQGRDLYLLRKPLVRAKSGKGGEELMTKEKNKKEEITKEEYKKAEEFLLLLFLILIFAS